MRVPLKVAQPVQSVRPTPQGLDLELCNVIREGGADRPAVLAEVDRLIQAGASLDGSCGPHHAAAGSQSDLLTALVQRGT